jgi:hypothetical protein
MYLVTLDEMESFFNSFDALLRDIGKQADAVARYATVKNSAPRAEWSADGIFRRLVNRKMPTSAAAEGA